VAAGVVTPAFLARAPLPKLRALADFVYTEAIVVAILFAAGLTAVSPEIVVSTHALSLVAHNDAFAMKQASAIVWTRLDGAVGSNETFVAQTLAFGAGALA